MLDAHLSEASGEERHGLAARLAEAMLEHALEGLLEGF
jgi:hypothetical protein